jgi:hypothetical protein
MIDATMTWAPISSASGMTHQTACANQSAKLARSMSMSLPPQRFDNRRCQPAWDRSRDAHPGLSRKLDLDCRRRRTLGSIPDRCDQYWGKTMADPDLSPPQR